MPSPRRASTKQRPLRGRLGTRLLRPAAVTAGGGFATIVGRTPPAPAESASATSITGNLPTDMQAGDIVIAHFAMSSTVATFTAPSGWTQLVAPTSDGVLYMSAAYYRFDPPSGPVGSTTSAAGKQTCICQAYGGVDSATPVDVAAQINVGSTPVTITAVTTATAGARLLSGTEINASTGTWTQPAGMTLLATHTSGVGRGAGLADEARPTAGTTGTRQWTWSATSQASVGYLVALRPAPAGGGSPFTRTASDTAAATDTADRALTQARAGSDTSAATDAATRGLIQSRTCPDTAAATDAAARGALAFIRTSPDTSAATDAAGRALVLARTAPSTSAATDAATRALSQSRTVSDTAAATDTAAGSVTPAGGTGRTASDTAAATDTATRAAQIFGRTASDAAAATDATTRSLTQARTATSASAATDAAVRTAARFRTASDTALATDAAVKALVRIRSTSDTAQAVDSAGRVLVLARTAVDAATAVDTAAVLIETQNATSTTAVTALRSSVSAAGSSTTSTLAVAGLRTSIASAGSSTTSISTASGRATSTPSVSDG